MGRITTNVGLITGFPIKDTVEQLVQLQAIPRDNLLDRNSNLVEQQTALTDLTAQLVSLKLNTDKLGLSSIYGQRNVTSSDTSIISVSAGDNPPLGSYNFTAIRQVQSQQLLSSKVASDTAALGGGSLSFQFGGEVDRGISLDLLNDGNGIERGSITITDRAGNSADIDLSIARTVDDVLDAINDADDIDVTISTQGDQFLLTDTSGGSGNLKVEEVNEGSVAATLGLAGIDVAANQATGTDVLGLFGDVDLKLLNDGLGIGFDPVLADLQFDFRDGTSLEVDFRKLGTTGTRATGTTTSVNGVNANVVLTADTEGSSQDGIILAYQTDPAVTKGNETVSYDEENRVLVVKIENGKSTAADVVAAINGDDEVKKLFTATTASGSNGASPVHLSDSTVLRGPAATATTAGTLDPNAAITFTAVTTSNDLDGWSIEFTHNAGVTAGNEIATADEGLKRVLIEINESTSTANDVINALNNDPTASAYFTAATATGSDGTGLIDVVNDDVFTAGQPYVEPVAGGEETTLADVLATLNAADPARLKAEIAADGERIVLTDLTADNGGTFTITGLNDSRVLEDLGLTTSASGDTINGTRIFSGLKTTLLTTLNGGAGLELGNLDLTDRSGATATVDLSSAGTLEDVVTAISAAGLGIAASINGTRDGILLEDTTGSAVSNLIVANNVDGLLTADKLGLTVDDAVTSIDGGSLGRQTVSENTLLSSLNGGNGVSNGSFKVTDTLGATQTINVNANIKTVGDLILEIERAGLQIDVRINDTGDGIVLVDTADGSETLKVEENGSNTARDLHILGESTTVDIGGTLTQVIDGPTTHTITLDAADSLQDLRDKINELGAGVTASIINDGSLIKPYRLNITSDNAGELGAVRLNASGLGITFQETVAAQDALLLIGNDHGGGVLASSSSNTFTDVVTDISVTVNSVSTSPVTISVEETESDLVSQMIAIVDTFNRIRQRVDLLTDYDIESDTRGLLQGDSAVLRLDADLNRLVTDRIFGAGPIQSLAQVGVTMNQDGSLAFDRTVLEDAYEEDREAIEQFFSATGTGLSDRFGLVLEQLSGVEESVLVNRTLAIGNTIASNEQRIERLNEKLDATRKLLLDEFINAEVAIGKIQGNLGALQSLAPLAPINLNTSSG